MQWMNSMYLAEEELTEIGKWQRTMGPIYIQWTAGAMLRPRAARLGPPPAHDALPPSPGRRCVRGCMAGRGGLGGKSEG
jgi:hypothetical protein